MPTLAVADTGYLSADIAQFGADPDPTKYSFSGGPFALSMFRIMRPLGGQTTAQDTL
jgi:hypothetical protein